MNEGIIKAIEVTGKQSVIAKALGVTQAAVSLWRLGSRVPAESAMEIERLTKGAVTREQICPKVNWTRA
jgi:DNA-binding transcriptional regulator YdaS (Cro superfamily)